MSLCILHLQWLLGLLVFHSDLVLHQHACPVNKHNLSQIDFEVF